MAMTHEELIQEINQLPPDKRKALAEAILRSVHEERSEERRVGKECTSWCRSRWSPYH